VVNAARDLFLERGYPATTIDAISDRSDVPTATVYRLFFSKLGILKALLDTSIAGDEQPLSVQERPPVAALLNEPEPEKMLAGFAASVVAINGRSNDIYRILSSAAGSDPGAAGLLAEYQHQRDDGQGAFARSLARADALRPGLRERDAADLIHVLMSPELYRLLVIERGWSPDRYQAWLINILAHQLIAPRPSKRRGAT
jgi:AcrR family transcriptional regulator